MKTTTLTLVAQDLPGVVMPLAGQLAASGRIVTAGADCTVDARMRSQSREER
jgi:hypothetical protein